jgi:hypothetical protein
MTGGQTKQKTQKPELLWGRLLAVTVLFVAAILLLSFAVPLTYGLGKSVANVIQAFETSCIDHDAWGKSPLN